MTEFEVARAGGRCFVTGRELQPGEVFYSALLDGVQGLERRDYSADAWSGPPEGTLCHFKTRLPSKETPKKTFVDTEALVTFFERLAGTEDPLRRRFRFVLALMLLRKRVLKYERTIREGGDEYWEMRLMRDRSLHRVLNPSLDDAQISELTAELSVILAGHAESLTGEDSAADGSPTDGAAAAELNAIDAANP